MIRKMMILAAAAAFMLIMAAPLALAGNKTGAWLDLKDCAICGPVMAEPGLMEHMHFTEQSMATGMVAATSVDPAYAEAYQRAGAKMQMLIERFMGGESMAVCGRCASIRELAMAGAKIEELDAAGSHLLVVSATDPKTIDRIHAHADRTNSEMQKMTKAEK